MGYSTEFYGSFAVSPTLSPQHSAYLAAFSESRRMIRDPTPLENRPDPLRTAVGLPLGPQGCYHVGTSGRLASLTEDSPVLNGNCPPEDQPGLRCQWCPSPDGTSIVWDEGEKFYLYVDWLRYLIEHFFEPWGYTLNGEVKWSGQEPSDTGVIRVVSNDIEVFGNIHVTNGEETRQLKVFLCHAKEDVDVVRRIQTMLEADFVHTWMDETDLLPGHEWRLEIEKALDSADLVIICLSNAAVDKTGYVQKEIALAMDLVQMQPEGRLFVIPLRLEECEVPRRLRQWQWLDIFSEDGESKLRQSLLKRAQELSDDEAA